MAKLRILCLHGFYNNVQVMKHQFAYYEYIFRDYIEFDYLNAPYECDEVYDPRIKEKFEGPFYRWTVYDQKTKTYSGFVESCKMIKDHFENNGEYDGIIAFSQGGYLIRTMMKADAIGMPEIKITPKFVSLVGSAVPHEHVFKDKNEGNYECPVLYIYGKKDPIIKGHNLAICQTGDSTAIIHEKGHQIPKLTGDHMETFMKFFNRFYEDKFNKPMNFDFTVDEEFREEFIKNSESKLITKNALHKL
ncbi:unnamed protein product [Moneuplotes crassus]|uniref:Serine hydrolase domain-containing protein n=1 Tax=Euplotes crassus TaxID=5936 RepID=A0AAD2D0H3_EUPCR|nr:unnamed protein product [Moneuplotes crassus]